MHRLQQSFFRGSARYIRRQASCPLSTPRSSRSLCRHLPSCLRLPSFVAPDACHFSAIVSYRQTTRVSHNRRLYTWHPAINPSSPVDYQPQSNAYNYKKRFAAARTFVSNRGLRIGVLTVWKGLSAAWSLAAKYRFSSCAHLGVQLPHLAEE